MTGKAEVERSGVDTAKLVAAVLLLVAGVLAFYWFAAESLLFRVLGLLAVVGVAVGIFATTAPGRALWGFLGESRNEVRKMVWPTRAEALQTTLIVILVVIIVAIFLWLVDMFLGWAVRSIIGTGA